MLDEIVGHTGLIVKLKKRMKLGTQTSFILSGPSGIGKRRIAISYAMDVNQAAYKRYSDIRIYAPLSSSSKYVLDDFYDISIPAPKVLQNYRYSLDNIRNIINDFRFVPAQLNFKIGIILHAEKMDPVVYNAFLKILEEPGERAFFILTTNNFLVLPETILSRLHVYQVGLLRKEEVKKILGFKGDIQNVPDFTTIDEFREIVSEERNIDSFAYSFFTSLKKETQFLQKLAREVGLNRRRIPMFLHSLYTLYEQEWLREHNLIDGERLLKIDNALRLVRLNTEPVSFVYELLESIK